MIMTAVEWLMLEKALVGYIDDEMVQQALLMEKQQIIEAHGIKTTRGERQGISFWERKTGEQYYNETYKKETIAQTKLSQPDVIGSVCRCKRCNCEIKNDIGHSLCVECWLAN